MELMFPGLSQLDNIFNQETRLREEILIKLKKIGIVELTDYFTPPNIKYFTRHVQECLALIIEASWLDGSFLKKIWNDNQEQTPFPQENLNKIQNVLFALVQQKKPDMKELNDILEHIVSWQRDCFYNYIGIIELSEQIYLKRVELLFLDRWKRVKESLENDEQDLIKYSLKQQWIEKEDVKELDWLKKITKFAGKKEKATVFMYNEFERRKETVSIDDDVKDSWAGLYLEACKNLYEHPFLPGDIKNSTITAQDIKNTINGKTYSTNWKFFLTDQQKNRLEHLYTLTDISFEFKWADLAISQELLDLFSIGIKNGIKHIISTFNDCGIILNTNISNWNDWCIQLDIILSHFEKTQIEPDRFIYDSFF